jgi:hypothetical protein
MQAPCGHFLVASSYATHEAGASIIRAKNQGQERGKALHFGGTENWARGGKLEGHTSGGNVQTIRISIFSNELELWFAPRGSSPPQ